MWWLKSALLGFLICLVCPGIVFTQPYKQAVSNNGAAQNAALIHPELTAAFYKLRGPGVFWMDNGPAALQLREALLYFIDSAGLLGLDPSRYHQPVLKASIHAGGDSSKDIFFTDAAIALCKDIFQGRKSSGFLGYDEISKQYETPDNDFIVGRLAGVVVAADLSAFIKQLEPADKEYLFFKQALAQCVLNNKAQAVQLAVRINLLRWIRHFRFEKYILVNIPSATLKYYQADTVALQMKVVVGKVATKTPRFAAFCNQLILYPYWNVPPSIALNEILPKVKQHPAWLDAMNLQVVNANGKVISPSSINWRNYNKSNFPFRFRQSTGCDNSLGVIKFNITDPYSVYMHDTNNQAAFLSGYRFYSHGCIRLEQPVQLGNLLLNNTLDTAYLQSCFKKQEPIIMPVEKPVAVFVVYSTADDDVAGRIKYYKDVYGLLK